MRYLDLLRNQANTARGWMFSCFVLAVVCMALAIQLVVVAGSQPVRLIPQSFDMSNGYMVVGNVEKDNADYLSAIAIGDIQSFTNWKPNTVENQTARFVNRFSPNLYASAGQKLEMAAKQRAKEQQSQIMQITKTSVKDGVVVIYGDVTMWQAQTRVSDIAMRYEIGYSFINGLPKINNFKAEKK